MSPGGETPRGDVQANLVKLRCNACHTDLVDMADWPDACPHCQASDENLEDR